VLWQENSFSGAQDHDCNVDLAVRVPETGGALERV
jgi:hypothetical protein